MDQSDKENREDDAGWRLERLRLSDNVLNNARTNRKIPTKAEKLLWAYLRNRNLEDLKFRRQQPLLGFILDFYCDEIKLGIEVDGGIHSLSEIAERDELCARISQHQGVNIIRFANTEVLNDIAGVLNRIKEESLRRKLSSNPSAPRPLLPGERGSVKAGAQEGREGTPLKYFRFTALLQSSGWLSPAYVGVDDSGNIQYLSDKAPRVTVPFEYVHGYVLPGFQNAHSHAFQYAMAGRAEKHKPGSSDDFWSWREAMYACALSMDPDQMKDVASMLYAEMLRNGYTHVAEFHYLHHDSNGKCYDNLPEMGIKLMEAAAIAGIKITLIPVFYQKGGFGKDPQPRQKRFISKTVDEYFRLLDESAAAIKNHGHANLGFSVHSLRAVEPVDIIKTFNEAPANLPFHLHAAEQLKEVEDCVAYLKQRPVEWILNNMPVSDRFHLVHCTHLTDEEVQRLARSNANAVLCPGTEGNLGDGIFRLSDFAANGGSWSIGTDSHISLNPVEDLRWLDYSQRLLTHKRNTFDDGGSLLIKKTVSAGRKAMGLKSEEYFSIGNPLDAVVFNSGAPLLSHGSLSHVVSGIVYTAGGNDITGTLINGKWIVKDGEHMSIRSIRVSFQSALKKISF
jgi:formimidoylglutamate deiminase